MGHVLRSHAIIDTETKAQVIPISTMRGTVADSWAGLRVYAVEPGKTYQMTATKYKSIKMGYFIGLLPRTSDHEGMLSIPQIGPAIGVITGISMAFLLALMFGAAAVGGASESFGRGRSAQLLKIFALSGLFASIAAFISLGILDTLLPEGDLRNKILRLCMILSLAIPLLGQTRFARSGFNLLSLVVAVGCVVSISLFFWPWVRGGMTWVCVLGLLTLVGVYCLSRMNLKVPALIWCTGLIDSLRILGAISTPDYPPVYFLNVGIFFALTIVAGELGGFNTIMMAGTAYRRFRRDLVLGQIKNSIEKAETQDSGAKVRALESTLPEIARMTGAGQLAITISLPLGRPITLTFNQKSNETKIFDDGKIPGAVTLRAMIYGDEAMFELFTEFARRLSLPVSPSFPENSFFCAVPLRVNQTIVGAMMLTGFDDALILQEKLKTSRDFMAEDRDIIHMVAERIAQSLSTLIVSDLSATTATSRALQQEIHRSIAAAASAEEFLARFAHSVHSVCGLGVMIHEHVGSRGVAVSQAGLAADHWDFFVQAPFNLEQQTLPAYGPTVVGFRDQKSSYVKDISEIFGKMHPKTVTILTAMNTMSVVAVPLRTSSRSFVITLTSTRDHGPADPGVVSVIEATEALFVAAIEVMSQKTSVLALGQLASRLIGDEEVRGKILEAARSPELPTTIGSPRTSFLLLFDLAGSSDLSNDTEVKARAYGAFYDAVNRKCQETFGGMIRKTIGDAVIVTWDGTNACLSDHPQIFEALKDVVHYADQVARDIGCKGARAVLHHGQYFLGLVGTQTFGQIDVIGSGIDEVCKLEGHVKGIRVEGRPIKLAISSTATSQLSVTNEPRMAELGFIRRGEESAAKTGLEFIFSAAERPEDVDHVA